MTIDTKELRRLAQAATPGPWYVTGKLTRYVEARIDGGLIQEVAACGPTKADGGYGPQQEANARLIAAANPATISELLSRLEAAEKERDAAELMSLALRAKIEQMEKQEPVGEIQRANSTGNYICSEVWVPLSVGAKLYALPGAQPAPSVPEDVLRDANRYRFLRAAKNIPISTKAARDPIVYDAAIDAAMLAAAPEVKK